MMCVYLTVKVYLIAW